MRVIAIDGPAGSGKTTVARALAARLGLDWLNTGAMYRAVTLAVLRAGGDPADEQLAAEVARTTDIKVDGDHVTLEGNDCSVEVRSPKVTRAVSVVAANPAVRAELVASQREWARGRGGVLEGRDIGTVVFPDAEFKVFVTVDPMEGARRRAAQEAANAPDSRGGRDSIVQAVAAELTRRDRIDSTRAADPLRPADDAVIVDTTRRSCRETIELILRIMEGQYQGRGCCKDGLTPAVDSRPGPRWPRPCAENAAP